MTTGLNGDVRRAGAPTGPLEGLVVADFSRVLAGPYATMLLGDMGADVIKVESPSGDDTRSWKPPTREGRSTYYLSINRNKRSIALNLTDSTDLETAHAIVRRADIMIENFRPGSLARFGLGYDDVSRENPGLVYASISGFGSGTGARIPGYDLMVQAISGLMSLTGSPGGPPFRAGISVFDVMTGLHATVGILAALRERSVSGLGQRLEVNLLSSALSGLVNQTGAFVAGDTIPTRMGNAHPSLFPYEPMPAADGEIVIIAGNDPQFAKLCAVLGAPELADDPRFARNEHRTANRVILRPLLERRLRTKTRAEWFDLLVGSGLACGPINSIAEGVEFADSLGLDPVVEVGEGDQMVPSIRHPIRFHRSPVDYRMPPPDIDEHAEQVRDWARGGELHG